MSPTPKFDLKKYLNKWQKKVNKTLDDVLPPEDEYPETIHKAMRYSVFAGGKRVRPVLCAAACEAVSGDPDLTLRTGAAIEMIHTYSLIHDDLPAMDDDDMRRGKATCHKNFGEAAAILAGDALLTEAFGVVVKDPKLDPWLKNVVIAEIVQAAGVKGMVGGQVVDMEKEGSKFDLADVDYIHEHKTAAMIRMSVIVGAIIGGANEDDLDALREYGTKLGLGFQVKDDVLNVTGGKDLGKGVGTDEERGKATYPAAAGLDLAKAKADELCGDAIMAIASFSSKAEPLRAVAKYVSEREN